MRNKKGFTLQEVLIAVAIIGILVAIMIPTINTSISRSRTNSAENDLRVFNSQMETMLSEQGKLTIDSSDNWSDADKETAIKYLKAMSSDYCKINFDFTHIKYYTGGLSIPTLTKEDPWGSQYFIMINTDSKSAEGGTIIFASAGPNGVFSTKTYKEGKFSDDVLVTIVPNI